MRGLIDCFRHIALKELISPSANNAEFKMIFKRGTQYILPRQNKMSDKYERIQGGIGDFNSAQICFRSLFRTFCSVLVIA